MSASFVSLNRTGNPGAQRPDRPPLALDEPPRPGSDYTLPVTIACTILAACASHCA